MIGIKLENNWYYRNDYLFNKLRVVETSTYNYYGQGYETTMVFNVQSNSKQTAQFSIFTTIFVMLILSAGTYFFSTDVNRLVIIPIERMVALVKKISANPLGVEYKVLGEKDGFIEGMETTILLSTITKIGGLMRVGFGEAGSLLVYLLIYSLNRSIFNL